MTEIDLGVIVKKQLLVVALMATIAASPISAGGTTPTMDANTVAQDAREKSLQDQQMVIGILTLGLFITLGIAH